MSFHFTDDAILTALLAVGGALFTLMQLYLQARARAASRDETMLAWGGRVIEVMTELDSLCAWPHVWPAEALARKRVGLCAETSALLDKGRLFFPNLKVRRPGDKHKAPAYRGKRPLILDKILLAHQAALALGDADSERSHAIREQLITARRDFVSLLQQEVGPSRRRTARRTRRAGEFVALKV